MKRMSVWGGVAIVSGLLVMACGQTGGFLGGHAKPAIIIPRETSDFKIYFSSNRDGGRELFRMDPDGEHPIRLTHSSGTKYFAVVTLDGSGVVFVNNDQGKR